MELVNERVRPFVRRVGLSNTLEPKFGWLAFPGLIRGITIVHVFMFMLLLLQPKSLDIFLFNWDLILAGEVWRLVSFFLIPPRIGGGTFSVLLMFIAVMIAFLVNDTLERSWGIFRTTLYCYGIIVFQILAHAIPSVLGAPLPITLMSAYGGAIFHTSIFLAFASTVPRYEFRLFFIIPVQVWVLGLVFGIILVLESLSGVWQAVYIYLCFGPYLVWALPRFLRWNRERGSTAARRARFRAQSTAAGESFHSCTQCGATDVSHPDRDFFVTEDDRELCDECLRAGSGESGPAQSTP